MTPIRTDVTVFRQLWLSRLLYELSAAMLPVDGIGISYVLVMDWLYSTADYVVCDNCLNAPGILC